MCIIFLALDHHPEYALIVASNRDEHSDRPTEHVHEWGSPPVIGGRDKRVAKFAPPRLRRLGLLVLCRGKLACCLDRLYN